MASLQDQLLKAGLVDQKKASKAKKAKHQQAKKREKNKVETVDEARLAAQQAQAEKVARDRELNAQHKAEAERKAVAAQVRQLIEMNRQPSGEGDVSYSFTDGALVKSLYVNDTQQKQLCNGRLCIVRLDEGYALIPTAVAEKIRQRDEAFVILSNQPTETADEDDPYAEFQVPDDLMW